MRNQVRPTAGLRVSLGLHRARNTCLSRAFLTHLLEYEKLTFLGNAPYKEQSGLVGLVA